MTQDEIFDALDKAEIPYEVMHEFEGSMWVRVFFDEEGETNV
jgi:hypothetical protein